MILVLEAGIHNSQLDGLFDHVLSTNRADARHAPYTLLREGKSALRRVNLVLADIAQK
jgi:hypothetical protein